MQTNIVEPKVFITSDTHFGHKNIIHYSKRPFQSIDEMNEQMIQRWNNTVGKEDTVYHLGDFAFGGPDFWHNLLDNLNGKIILIEGNHDKKALKDPTIRAKFAETHLYLEKYIEGTFVVMCHFPIQEWNKCSQGAYHLHGHCHGSRDAENNSMRRLDVGVDGFGKGHYSPQPWLAVRNSVEWRPIISHHDN